MTSIALFLLLTAGAILLLVMPFLRRQIAPDRRDFDLTVYQDQLDELERDLDRGIIDAEAARAAKLEIERRILAAAEDGGGQVPSADSRGAFNAMATAALVLIIPLASGLYYVSYGRPDMPDMPLAGRDMPEQQLAGQDPLQANIEQLQEHLETTPDNGPVWAVLGRTQLRAGRYQEAVDALMKAVEFTPDDPTIEAELAEAMVYTAGGQVVPAALDHFKATLEKIPNEPRSRYYLGLALAQEGEADAAIEGWTDLLKISPSDAPWRPQIIEAVQSVLESEGRPADEIIANLPKGTDPSTAAAAGGGVASQQAAIEALPPEEQTEQIRGMVEGLAARLESEPDDVQGWLMLGRSRLVLGEPEAAKTAFERAMSLEPENLDVIRAYAGSLLGDVDPETKVATVGEEAAGLYKKLIELEPNDPEAHWYLGLAAVQDGTVEEAKTHWQQVLDLLGPDHPNYAAVQSSLEEVETKTQ